MARVNYQRDKRLKDLDRQRKQEEKRNRKLQKGETPLAPVEGEPETQEEGQAEAPPQE